MPKPPAEGSAPAPKIRVRVVSAQYGAHLRGEIVEVDQSELDRLTPIVDKTVETIDEITGAKVSKKTREPDYSTLIPLSVERQLLEQKALSRPVDNVDAEKMRAATEGWAALGRKSTAAMARFQREQVKKQLGLAEEATKE